MNYFADGFINFSQPFYTVFCSFETIVGAVFGESIYSRMP